MDIGTAKPGRGRARRRAASPHRHRRSHRGLFGGTLSRRRACASPAQIHARGKVPALRGRHDALLPRALARAREPSAGAARATRARSRRRPRERAGPRCTRELARVDPAAGRAHRARRRAAHPARARGASPLGTHADRSWHAREPARRCPSRRSGSRWSLPIARCCTGASRSASARCSTRASSTSWRACAGATRSRPKCRRCARWATGRPGRCWKARAPPATLEARGTAATRQLAKRQLTWQRAMDDVERLDCLRAGPRVRGSRAGRALPAGLVFAVELEAHLELHAIDDLAVVDLHVELLDFGHAQVANGARGGLHGIRAGFGPRYAGSCRRSRSACRPRVPLAAFLGHVSSFGMGTGKRLLALV